MTLKHFLDAMKRGLGRCYLELQSCDDIEKYRGAVLWGCTHPLAFDAQCEGTRAVFLYRLIGCFPDPDFFIDRIAETYAKVSGRDTWFFLKLTELLSFAASDGSETAREALSEKYGNLYGTLLGRRRFGRGYDFKRDNFENLTVCLLGAGTVVPPKRMVADYGYLITHNKHYELRWFDWFIFRLEETVGQKRLTAWLKKYADDPSVDAFYRAYLAYREEVENERAARRAPPPVPTAEELRTAVEAGEDVSPAKRAAFGRRSKAEEKEKLADAIEAEPDPRKKAALLGALRLDDYPGDHARLAAYASSDCAELADAAREVLTYCRSEAAYRYAKQALERDMSDEKAIEILLMNYRPADKELLCALNGLKIDYACTSGWHGAVSQIVCAQDRGVKLPREFFMFVYEKSLCSFCRESAVRYMGRRRWLTPDMIAECLYDSNDDIAAYAEKIEKRRDGKA